jgi:hypothetical protein
MRPLRTTQVPSTISISCNSKLMPRFADEFYLDSKAEVKLEDASKEFIDWQHMELKAGLKEGSDYYLISSIMW